MVFRRKFEFCILNKAAEKYSFTRQKENGYRIDIL